MTEEGFERLWKDFPKTLPEFEARFAEEAQCRAYLIAARWGDRVSCVQCGHEKTWERKDGLFECARCSHLSSVTAGTVLQGTRKPLKLWFRAIWEVCVHRQGISAKDLQRLMGFGSYETAWTWLRKLRRAMVDSARKPLGAAVQMDEGLLGAKGTGRAGKSFVLVAAEPGGRVRMARAGNNDEASLCAFADHAVGFQAHVTTDGLASYNRRSLGSRGHTMTVQKPAQRQQADAVQHCHWAISNLKRWWLGTHHGAISDKHLQAYLDEFVIRFNRRKTQGVGRLVARAVQFLVRTPPMTMREWVHGAATRAEPA